MIVLEVAEDQGTNFGMSPQYILSTTKMAKECETKASKPRIPYKMYLSRALSAWGDRMWDFGGGLFMMGLHYDDLRLVAIYGFARCFTVIVFGAAIGNWIDRSERLSSTRVFLAIQVVKSKTHVHCVAFKDID